MAFSSFLDHALLPRLDKDSLGIRSSYGSDLWNRSSRTIIVHYDIIEDRWVRLAHAICLEIFFEEVHSLFHFLVSSSDNLIYFW